MISFTQPIFDDPRISKMFDWSIFVGGLASLIFAVTMTVLGVGDTRNADADMGAEILTSL